MSEDYMPYLQSIVQEPIRTLQDKGFVYLQHALMPRLLEAGKNKSFSRELLSLAWCRIAELHWQNGAPGRAEELLKKAMAASKNNSEVFLMLAKVQNSVGMQFEALGNIEQALQIAPDNFEHHTLKQKIQDDLNYSNPPELDKDDAICLLQEMLADEKFETVINTVLDGEMNNGLEMRCLARAFGAVSHHENYLNVWNRILTLDPECEASIADWFYLPVDLRETAILSKPYQSFV